MQHTGTIPTTVPIEAKRSSWLKKEQCPRTVSVSMIDFESHKINRVVRPATVSELYYLTKCFGTCQFLCGLWMDISVACVAIHMRIDVNNCVIIASTARLPEQKETIHMIQILRKESCSGKLKI